MIYHAAVLKILLELISKEDKAKQCGYYTVTKNGVERVNMMKFLNALIDAEGIELDTHSSSDGRGGRSASYKISVQRNQNLLIGSAYTKQMGLEPGDEFKITFFFATDHAKLKVTFPASFGLLYLFFLPTSALRHAAFIPRRSL